MIDPFFEVAVSEIRGFDLGDDDEIRADLHARQARGDALDGDDWMLLGVLQHRGDNDGEAIASFEHAALSGHAISLARYLQAQLLMTRSRFDEVSALLDVVESAAEDDELVPRASILHARGTVARAQGAHDDALVLYRAALAEDPSGAIQWLQTAQLLADRGEIDEALAAIERALSEDPDCDDAMYERAALAARAQDGETAASWLERAIRHEDHHRARAAKDPRFDVVRLGAPVAKLFEPPTPPDLKWLNEMPAWVAALRIDPGLADMGVVWLGRAESERVRADLEQAYESGPLGTMHTEETLALSRELLQGRRAIARGPSSRTRDRVDEPSLLFVDSANPSRVYIALSEGYPPFLWIDGGSTAVSVTETLTDFFPRPRLERLQLTACARGFMGYRMRFGVPSPYTGDSEPANAAELDRHFAINPFVEAASWGSAYDEDPWPAEIPAQRGYMLKMSERQRRVAAQAKGHVWAVSRRTRHSRSYLSIELHHRDVFVAEVRYRPSRHRDVVARMNAHFGCDYPEDMPLDAIAALMGFHFDGSRDLQLQLDATADPDEIAGLLYVLSALGHSDLGMVRIYRRYMDHPDPVVRSTLCNVFMANNYESLLEEMSAIERDEEIRSHVESVLDDGIAVPENDPYTDYDLDDDGAEEDDA